VTVHGDGEAYEGQRGGEEGQQADVKEGFAVGMAMNDRARMRRGDVRTSS
jgi:hypothetical protein